MADQLRDLPPSRFRDFARRPAEDTAFRMMMLQGIGDAEARTVLLRLAGDTALQREVWRYQQAVVAPALVAGQERFRRAFGDGLRVARLDVPVVHGYEYRDAPELIEEHVRRFLAEVGAPREPGAARASPPPPILDVHLHALGVDMWGTPSPVAICAPLEQHPVWAPARQTWDAFFAEVHRGGKACDAPLWSPRTDAELMRRTIEVLERRNVHGVLSGTPAHVAAWQAAAPGRFIPGLHFMLSEHAAVTPDSLRRLVAAGAVRVFGEVANWYDGVAPDDPRMAPYWALAEELDVPVGIHVGPGRPGEPYAGYGARGRLSSALTLEEVLVRHPRLRVYVMHAGYPLLDDLLALMYAHPQVYVDVGAISFFEPRAAFHAYLRRIVETGFGNRVMFGSDQALWPEAIERAIAAIEEAPYLSAAQKRDILYHNAARFLRLGEAEIARHHAATAR